MKPLPAAIAAIVVLVAHPRLADAQSPSLITYQQVLDRYMGGTHVASVIDVLKLDPTTVTADALATLAADEQRYELSRESVPGRGRSGTSDGARAYLRRIEAVALLHLEAATSAPLDRVSQRAAHLDIADKALARLDASRKDAWTSDPSIDAASRAAVLRFRRDWLLAAATHFQRIGAFADAFGFARAALDEHPDEPLFHVIAGTIAEALAAPVASFDTVRAAVGLTADPDEGTRRALREAARRFARALALNADDAEARVRLARVQVRLGAFNEARRLLAADASPGRLAYLLALARGYAAAAESRHAEAVDHYRAATRLAPQWQSACVALAHALVAAGERDEARDTLRPCLSRVPSLDDPWPRYGMGLDWLLEPTVRQLRAQVTARSDPE